MPAYIVRKYSTLSFVYYYVPYYFSDTDEGQIPTSSSSKSKPKDRTTETQTSDSEETFRESRTSTIATSKVQDNCKVRESKDTSAIPVNFVFVLLLYYTLYIT